MLNYQHRDHALDESRDLWLFGYGSLIWKPPPHFDQRVVGYIENHVRRFWQASEDHRGTVEAPGRVATLLEYEFWKTLDDKYHHPNSNPPRVWGTAYRIPAGHVAEVREYLDLREINGYTIEYKLFYPALWALDHALRQRGRQDRSGVADRTYHQGESENNKKDEIATGSSGMSTPSSNLLNSLPLFQTTPFPCLLYIGQPENPQFMGVQDPEELARHIVNSEGPSGKNSQYLYKLEEALRGLLDEPHIKEFLLEDENRTTGSHRSAISATTTTRAAVLDSTMLSELADDDHIFDLSRRCRDLERKLYPDAQV